MPRSVRIILSGVAFAVAGVVATVPFLLGAESPADTARSLVPAAGVSAFFVGALLWALIVSGSAERWRPPVAGALTGLIAHPIMWMLISIPVGIEMDAEPGQRVSGAIVSAALFGFFSVLAYGPLTVPLGAIVGWLLGKSGMAGERAPAKRSTPTPPVQPGPPK